MVTTPFQNVLILYSICGLSICCMVIFVFAFGDRRSPYFNFGPNEHLTVASVPINSWTAYILLHTHLCVLEVSVAFMKERCGPLLESLVFNTTGQIVCEYSKHQLHIFSSIYSTIKTSVFIARVLIIIAQCDFALFVLFYKELATFVCVYLESLEKQLYKSSEQDMYLPLMEHELKVFREFSASSTNSTPNSDESDLLHFNTF
jgi:hypothetical protein